MDGAPVVGKGERFAEDRLVRGEVFFGDDPALVEDVAGDSARQLPLVEQVRPFSAYGLQGVSELREPHFLARAMDPVADIKVLLRLLGEPEYLFRDLKPHATRLGKPEAFSG